MLEKNTNPNQLNPQTLSRVKRASQAVLDLSGTIGKSPISADREMQSAIVPIDNSELTQVPEGVMPTVSINRPVGDFAKKARWSYEITYGMQDSVASRHILIMNGENPEAEVAFYDGSTPDRQLTEIEAQAIANDLSGLAEV